jgi:hypothetical protein
MFKWVDEGRLVRSRDSLTWACRRDRELVDAGGLRDLFVEKDALVEERDNQRMDLPEHWQPSSDERILAWVGTLATLTAAAVWLRSARTRAQRPRDVRS